MKCPKCGSKNVSRERRPNGNDECADCHYAWPSGQVHIPVDACPKCGVWLGVKSCGINCKPRDPAPVDQTDEFRLFAPDSTEGITADDVTRMNRPERPTYEARRDAAAEAYTKRESCHLPGENHLIMQARDRSIAEHFKSGYDAGHADGIEEGAKKWRKSEHHVKAVEDRERLTRELAEAKLNKILGCDMQCASTQEEVKRLTAERNGAEDAAVNSAMLLATANAQIEKLKAELERYRHINDEEAKEVKRLTAELANAIKGCHEYNMALRDARDAAQATAQLQADIVEKLKADNAESRKNTAEFATNELAWRDTVEKLQAENAEFSALQHKMNKEMRELMDENAEYRKLLEDGEWKVEAALRKERDAAKEMCERLAGALEQVAQLGNDGVVVCRKCGDEETLQDADFMFVVRDMLAEYEACKKKGS